jgi:L-fuconolactonase
MVQISQTPSTIYNNQIDELAKLVRVHPNVDIMLSHLATPISVAGEFVYLGKTKLERDNIFNAWRDSKSSLAEKLNVYLKLSGLAKSIYGFQWHKNQSSPSPTEVAKSFGPIINHAIDVFGDDRCLFGSNYPTDKLILSTLIEAYQMIFENLADNQ